jgi:hypothetical protein
MCQCRMEGRLALFCHPSGTGFQPVRPPAGSQCDWLPREKSRVFHLCSQKLTTRDRGDRRPARLSRGACPERSEGFRERSPGGAPAEPVSQSPERAEGKRVREVRVKERVCRTVRKGMLEVRTSTGEDDWAPKKVIAIRAISSYSPTPSQAWHACPGTILLL